MKKRIAIFASGSGTNAENFFTYFKNSDTVEVALLASNNSTAFALERAKNHGIHTFVFSREEFYSTETVTAFLQKEKIDVIVLAGFLWLIPDYLIHTFPERIINIHPALLPKYGGKGMYGMHVHESVKANNETVSGITIHLVNEVYDQGRILAQEKVELSPSDTPDDIASKVHQLEYDHFPKVVQEYITR